MTFAEAVAKLWAKHPKAELSPPMKRGKGICPRGPGQLQERQERGVYVERDTDGTELLAYFNDAKIIACTEIEPDDE